MMNARRYLWLTVCVMGCALSGCAGGSGSSGFDITENAAINQVLESGDCQEVEGLRICPANAVPTVATATPTATRTPIQIRTPSLVPETPTTPSDTPAQQTTASPTMVPPPPSP